MYVPVKSQQWANMSNETATGTSIHLEFYTGIVLQFPWTAVTVLNHSQEPNK